MKTNSQKPLETPFKLAMAAWEIGHVASGFGCKVGGLGAVVDELPKALVKAAWKRGLRLTIDTFTLCLASYRREDLKKLPWETEVKIDGVFERFEAYEGVFTETVMFLQGNREIQLRVVYFWNEKWLGRTTQTDIYPSDPVTAVKTYAAVSHAIAAYIQDHGYDAVHLHDYHVGLIPFYLGEDCLDNVNLTFTIHNGSYQGVAPVSGDGAGFLQRLGIPGDKRRLYRDYFEHNGCVNLMKAAIRKVREEGGEITTVSVGYSQELCEDKETIWARAAREKGDLPVDVFLPNGGLDILETVPVRPIPNGMDASNWPQNQPLLKAAKLQEIQAQKGKAIFSNPEVQAEMLRSDHNYDAGTLGVKGTLTRLLHLEAFGSEPPPGVICISVVGRLVYQKNLGLVTAIVPTILRQVPAAKFVILASAPDGDAAGKADELAFRTLAERFPDKVYFNNSFNEPLSKLILAGSHLMLIPSRFEPGGLVDLEASLCGTVVVARKCGGLAKIQGFGYLYDWLDVGDREGEARVFTEKLMEALRVFQERPALHKQLMLRAMNVDATWDSPAGQYLEMYLAGIEGKRRRSVQRASIANAPTPDFYSEAESTGVATDKALA
jgi:glycogen synthase